MTYKNGMKKYNGMKMDHGMKQKLPKMTPKPAVTGNIHGAPDAVGTTNWMGYHSQQSSSNPREVVKHSEMQTKDVRPRGLNQTDKEAMKEAKGKGIDMGSMSDGNAMNKTGMYQDRDNGMLKNHGMLKDLGMMRQEGMRGMRKMRGLHQKDEQLTAATSIGESSDVAQKAKSQAKEEGYKTESVTEKGNVRSTVMALETPKPQTITVEESKPTKQYAGAYVKRKFLPGYKPVKSESAEEAFVGQKRKGRLTSFENVDKKAKR